MNFTRVPADADIVLNKPTDTSDANGNVVTTVNSGTTPTSFRVRATLPDTGNGGADIVSHVWPIALFMAAVTALAMWRYRQTLD